MKPEKEKEPYFPQLERLEAERQPERKRANRSRTVPVDVAVEEGIGDRL